MRSRNHRGRERFDEKTFFSRIPNFFYKCTKNIRKNTFSFVIGKSCYVNWIFPLEAERGRGRGRKRKREKEGSAQCSIALQHESLLALQWQWRISRKQLSLFASLTQFDFAYSVPRSSWKFLKDSRQENWPGQSTRGKGNGWRLPRSWKNNDRAKKGGEGEEGLAEG